MFSAGSSRRRRALGRADLALQQVEEVADPHYFFQLLVCQADTEAIFDLHHHADQVQRVESHFLAEVDTVFRRRGLVSGLALQKLDEGLANHFAIRHGFLPWLWPLELCPTTPLRRSSGP